MPEIPFTDPSHPQVFRNPKKPVVVEVDACVIGSGAGGSTIAAELAEAGIKVAIFEKGPYVTRKAMNQLERDMVPLLYEDSAARTTKDGGIIVLHGHCVGGTTVVNNAISFDPPDWLLEEWATKHGVLGLSGQDLAPAIAKVNYVLNVQKLRPEEMSANGKVMMRGAKALGLSGDTFRHNRTQCVLSGFCMVGCAYDRKQNHHITYVPRALSFGATLYPDAQISRVVAKGSRALQALGHIKNRATGKSEALAVTAKVFILAGGAISSPALLQLSALGNDQVGRNLHLHPIGGLVADMGNEEVKAYEGIPQSYYVDHYLRRPNGESGFLLESIFVGPSLSAALMPLWGRPLEEFMARFNHLAAAYTQVRDENSGRVTVDGRGVPVIDYTLGEADAHKLRSGLETLSRLFFAAGAKGVYYPHQDAPVITTVDQLAGLGHLAFVPNALSLTSAHQMGTCRMGEDPRISATNSVGKLHGIENLFLADSSVFPTAIGINPQITISSLATHFAWQMISERTRLFGG